MTLDTIPDTADDLAITETDIRYANPGVELLARVYQPAEPHPEGYPTVISVHGGAWSRNDRRVSELANRTLAASGLVIVSPDYRQGPDYQHPSASCDVVACVRWTKARAAEFGGNPDSVGLLGFSSGGHLALLAALRPRAEEHQQTELVATDVTGVDGAVRFVVACWPVSDPYYRYQYARKVNRERLIYGSLAYFGDEETMKAASVPRLLDDGAAEETPPLLLVQPGEDQNVPLEMTQYLMRAYQKRRGHLEYAYFPGEPHAFTYEPSQATEQCLAIMGDFIRRQSV